MQNSHDKNDPLTYACFEREIFTHNLHRIFPNARKNLDAYAQLKKNKADKPVSKRPFGSRVISYIKALIA